MTVKRLSQSFSPAEVKFLHHMIRTVTKEHRHLVSVDGYAGTYRKILAMNAKAESMEVDAQYETAAPLCDATEPRGGEEESTRRASV